MVSDLSQPFWFVGKLIFHRLVLDIQFSCRVYGQTARHSKSWLHNPPNYQILYLPTQNILIFDTALSIGVSPQTIDFKTAPHLNSMMLKEPKRKTNQHAHSTHDQNTGPFSKRKIKWVFSAIDHKQGYLGPVCPKES